MGAAATLAMLGGCAAPGDFGRWPASVDKVEPIHTGSTPASTFPLTDDERQLRALAKRILGEQDLYIGTRAIGRYSGPAVAAVSPAVRRDQYAQYIVRGPFRSATARYSKLIDDTRNDLTRLDPFFAVARRVADLDRKRQNGLAHVSLTSEAEVMNARRRIRENMMLMAEVQRTLLERVDIYRFTLERLVITVPSPMAVDAERLRADLEQRLAAIEIVGPERAAAAPRVVTAK